MDTLREYAAALAAGRVSHANGHAIEAVWLRAPDVRAYLAIWESMVAGYAPHTREWADEEGPYLGTFNGDIESMSADREWT